MADAGAAAGTQLDIRRFDPSTLKPDKVCLLIGKRNTGKTVLMKDLLYHLKDQLDFGLYMSPTEESTGALRGIIPPSLVYGDYNSTAVEVLLEMQKQYLKSSDKSRNVFLLLDDCMYDKKTMKGREVREIFMNGRHRRLLFLNCVQYLMDISPALRTNVDFVFCMRENIAANRRKLYEFFFGVFASLQDFEACFNACTQGFRCIVLDNTVRSNRIEDCIFWYQAEYNLPSFRLCAPAYWALNKRYEYDYSEEAAPVVGVAEQQEQKTCAGARKRKNFVSRVVRRDTKGDGFF